MISSASQKPVYMLFFYKTHPWRRDVFFLIFIVQLLLL
jgi:hypothetical protein